jgi:hypothetical protein
LGYGIDQVAREDVQCYFARSVAWHIHDRQRLNVADPLIEKLLRRSLFDAHFCERALPSGPPPRPAL